MKTNLLTAALALAFFAINPVAKADNHESHEGHEHHAVESKHTEKDKEHVHSQECKDKHMVDGKICDEHVKKEKKTKKEKKKS